jgi:hypothetical protein
MQASRGPQVCKSQSVSDDGRPIGEVRAKLIYEIRRNRRPNRQLGESHRRQPRRRILLRKSGRRDLPQTGLRQSDIHRIHIRPHRQCSPKTGKPRVPVLHIPLTPRTNPFNRFAGLLQRLQSRPNPPRQVPRRRVGTLRPRQRGVSRLHRHAHLRRVPSRDEGRMAQSDAYAARGRRKGAQGRVSISGQRREYFHDWGGYCGGWGLLLSVVVGM